MNENNKKKNKNYYRYHNNQNKNYYYKKKKKKKTTHEEIGNILLSSYEEIPRVNKVYQESQNNYEEEYIPIKKESNIKKSSLKIFYRLGFVCLILIAVILKTSYSFFTYQKIDTYADIKVGEVYVKIIEDTANINLKTMYPMEDDKARESEDNYFVFTIKAKNTSTSNVVQYSIDIKEGEDIPNKKRINPEYIKVDVEENIDGEYKYIQRGTSLSKYSFKGIIPANTNSEVVKKYRVRLWIGDNVIISDDDPNKTYTQSEYNNLYANYSISVDAYDEKQ